MIMAPFWISETRNHCLESRSTAQFLGSGDGMDKDSTPRVYDGACRVDNGRAVESLPSCRLANPRCCALFRAPRSLNSSPLLPSGRKLCAPSLFNPGRAHSVSDVGHAGSAQSGEFAD